MDLAYSPAGEQRKRVRRVSGNVFPAPSELFGCKVQDQEMTPLHLSVRFIPTRVGNTLLLAHCFTKQIYRP